MGGSDKPISFHGDLDPKSSQCASKRRNIGLAATEYGDIARLRGANGSGPVLVCDWPVSSVLKYISNASGEGGELLCDSPFERPDCKRRLMKAVIASRGRFETVLGGGQTHRFKSRREGCVHKFNDALSTAVGG